jgi:hypothetical protein
MSKYSLLREYTRLILSKYKIFGVLPRLVGVLPRLILSKYQIIGESHNKIYVSTD